jgi:hypothetical protein
MQRSLMAWLFILSLALLAGCAPTPTAQLACPANGSRRPSWPGSAQEDVGAQGPGPRRRARAGRTAHPPTWAAIAAGMPHRAARQLPGHRPCLGALQDRRRQRPAFPESEAPSDPAAGYTWDDIRYVIGGYGWMATVCRQTGLSADRRRRCHCPATIWRMVRWIPSRLGRLRSRRPRSPLRLQPRCHPQATSLKDTRRSCRRGGYLGRGRGRLRKLPWARQPACQQPLPDHRCRSSVTAKHVAPATRAPQPRRSKHDGFIDHNRRCGELFSSKKRVMECVDCHNPHETVKYGRGGARTLHL